MAENADTKLLRRNSLPLKNTATGQGSVFDITNRSNIFRRNSISVYLEEAFGIFTKGGFKSSNPTSPGLEGTLSKPAETAVPAASSELKSSPSLTSIAAVPKPEALKAGDVESDSKTTANKVTKNTMETANFNTKSNTTPETIESTTTLSKNLNSDTSYHPATPSTPRTSLLPTDPAPREDLQKTTSITGVILTAAPNTTDLATSKELSSMNASSTTSNSPDVNIRNDDSDEYYVFDDVVEIEKEIISTRNNPERSKTLLKEYIAKTRLLLNQEKVSLAEYDIHIREFLEALEVENWENRDLYDDVKKSIKNKMKKKKK